MTLAYRGLLIALAVVGCNRGSGDNHASDRTTPPSAAVPALPGSRKEAPTPDSARYESNLESAFTAVDRLAGSEAVLIARHGTPTTRNAEPTENRFTGATDSAIALEFPGVRAQFYRIMENGRDLLLEIEITDSSYALPFGLRVGAPLDSVLYHLGPPFGAPPALPDASRLLYMTEMMHSELTVVLQAGRVVGTHWFFAID